MFDDERSPGSRETESGPIQGEAETGAYEQQRGLSQSPGLSSHPQAYRNQAYDHQQWQPRTESAQRRAGGRAGAGSQYQSGIGHDLYVRE